MRELRRRVSRQSDSRGGAQPSRQAAIESAPQLPRSPVAKRPPAPKGRVIPAQGNALGHAPPNIRKPCKGVTSLPQRGTPDNLSC
jgi:hypothetical protein